MKCNDLQELAAASAVGALTPEEASQLAGLAAQDADLRGDLARFQDAAAAMAAASAGSATPSRDLRQRVLARIARTPQAKAPEAAALPKGFHLRRNGEGEWQATPYPGVRMKMLSVSPDLGHWTVLVELMPGASFPTHDHNGSEDLLLMSGDLVTEGQTLAPGDFLHAEPKTHHHALVSPSGCIALVVEPIPAHVRRALDAAAVAR